MIKIRLHGTQKEINKSILALENTFYIISKSKLYKDRGGNLYYRIYLECSLK